MAKARLQFSELDDSIWIFCVSREADELSKFEKGEEIFVVGRLVIRGVNRRAAIAVDHIETKSMQTPDARAEAQFHDALKSHHQNARVPGR